jgi:tRNA-binding EMAP/Myf-like protein
MKCRTVFLVLAALTVAHVNAAPVEIRGVRSCGLWIEGRAAKSFAGTASESWFVGYMSGLASGVGKDALAGTDNASLFAWVDKECRANLLLDLDDVGKALFSALVRQKKL